ncbi:MAG: GNAT family N-acetyltransferase, partial [Lachnospiraceae bacterium]|nr:GNAT family N-acetyltransferase [Lachnospiraceae bacterium]
EFYNSPAVLHKIPKENYEATFNELLRNDQYASCYIFEVPIISKEAGDKPKYFCSADDTCEYNPDITSRENDISIAYDADTLEIDESNMKVIGYALLSKTWSQEAGGLTIWIEEIYIREEGRGQGLGREFIEYIKELSKGKVKRIRLEVEDDNQGAKKLYKSLGFKELNYKQMIYEEEL